MKLNLIARACAVALTLSIASMPAFAKLAAGAPAPDFSAPAARHILEMPLLTEL